jgi:hypothetical protein
MRPSRPLAPALLLVAATLALPLAPAGPTSPPNDNRENALPVAADAFATAQPTFGATVQSGEVASCETVGATVWYVYRPAATSIVKAATHGSNFDTVLAVYLATPEGLVSLGCSDDAAASPNGFTSEVRFRAGEGSTYYIQAGGYAGASGVLAFRMTSSLVPA